jgi:hypothetical protein
VRSDEWREKEKKDFTAEFTEGRRGNGDSGAGLLFGAEGEDLFALNFNFDAERRANVTALHDSAANPDATGKAGGPQGIIKSVAARVAHERMISTPIVIIVAEFVEVADVFELAVAVGGLARESPIA